MDAMISSFNAFEAKEVGPLILAWAVFLCLISSLPEKEENNLLMVHVSIFYRMSHHYIACAVLLQPTFFNLFINIRR